MIERKRKRLTNDHWNTIDACRNLIENSVETEENIGKLKELLIHLSGIRLPPIPIQTSENAGINVTLAALAIAYCKGEFFKILAEEHPEYMCTALYNKSSIMTSLMLAVHADSPKRVEAVLINPAFKADEHCKQDIIRALKSCKSFELSKPRAPEIKQLLEEGLAR